MIGSKNIGNKFYESIEILGFHKDDNALFLTDSEKETPAEIRFFINKAIDLKVSAVYFRRLLNGSYKPQVYLYDFTKYDFNEKFENKLTEIHKKVWSSGEVPIVCLFFKTEIKILNCSTHISDEYKPAYLIENLKIVGKAHNLFNEQFAFKIKSGIFWEEEIIKNKFKFSKNSSYNKLIENIHYITTILQSNYKNIPKELINKIIVQSILIKYLEERIDSNGKKLLSDKFFKQFAHSDTFVDVLRNNKFAELLIALNNPITGFNGNIFQWTNKEQLILQTIDLSILADLLSTETTSLASKQLELKFPNWRYFEFKYIPVELISRLYEEFLGDNKKEKGLYYTPAHLAKLLVDESLPLFKYKEINVESFKVLDPACGSGIFLVITFKRLVQIWRLQNGMKHPNLNVLKKILRNIYGIDYEKQAIELASFSLSLALCNELEPLDIINNLKFDDLRKNNLIHSDFFESKNKLKKLKFDLIIGNPPFKRGAIKEYSNKWIHNGINAKIPQGQIALKFLSESIPYLKDKGLLCLIIKSSGLLYNSSSFEYKKVLFSKFNVVQIFDFTALARNKSLWDNGADVASAAIFLKRERPSINQNILHLTFRRTKATVNRIIFEIDDYDLHFIDRLTAIENEYIWKNNLLGGGRIKTLIEKTHKLPSFENFIKENNCMVGEGFIIGTKGKLQPDFMYKLPTLPTKNIKENDINISNLPFLSPTVKFEKIPDKILFTAPNILIWENIGKKRLPVFYNKNNNFSYRDKIIGIASKDVNKKILETIIQSFKTNNDFYRFQIFTTSSQVLINLNTAILKKDIVKLPFIEKNFKLSDFDRNIISDVNTFMQDFLRHGENSKAVKPIPVGKFNNVITNYGQEFSKVLNLIYEEHNKKFRLSDVVRLQNSYIATIFKYDSKKDKAIFHSDYSKVNLKELSDFEISKQLTVNRIIKLYPNKDTIVFIKPNQYRYWLSLIAYRDADKCFSDLSKLGY